MEEEEKKTNEEKKYLEKQLQLLSEMSEKENISSEEICRLTGAMIEVYKTLRSIFMS